jgi:hypothetical protein
MHMEMFAAAVKARDCGQNGDGLGIPRHPDPTHLILKFKSGAPAVMDWPGWDVVMAYVLQEYMHGVRDGNAVILTPAHWSATLWGRA